MRVLIVVLPAVASFCLLASCSHEPAIPPHGTYATLLQAAEAADLYGALDNLRQGADLYAADAAGLTPLLVAVEKNLPDLAEALFSAGAPPDQTDALGNNALHLAAAANNLYMVEYLPARGVPVNARNQENLTPLHVAAIGNHPQACKKLLAAGADPVAMARKEDASSIPLQMAAQHKSFDAVAALQDAGTLYSIFAAAAAGDLEAVKRQIAAEPSKLNEVEAHGKGFAYSPLQYALLNNQIEVARYLHEKGAEFSEVNNDGAPFLFTYADFGFVEALRYAASIGANINIATPNTDRSTLLHHLATRDLSEAVWAAAFELGADPNLKNAAQASPLHLAVAAKKTDNVRRLLEHGADRNLLDGQGKTALQLAMETDFAPVTTLLSE